MPSTEIKITGARQHNLQNLNVTIPREKLVVVTGPSGSGKSSLAFDTIFAEGQRKYVESLSAYARQFLDQLQKPEVDFIEGLSPAIAIEQRTTGGNPRSTIATTTEIYDYLRLLYSAVGRPHDPATGEVVKKQSPQQIVDALLAEPEDTRMILLAPVVDGQSGEFRDVLEKLRRDGFIRARIDGELVELETPKPIRLDKALRHNIDVVVDRLVVREGIRSRMADSVETALKHGGNRMSALIGNPETPSAPMREEVFSTNFGNPKTGFWLPKLTPRHFSFNSHLGACPACHGLGTSQILDPGLMVDVELSLEQGAIKPWNKGTPAVRAYYQSVLKALAAAFQVPMDRPVQELPAQFLDAALSGTGSREIALPGKSGAIVNKTFEGVIASLNRLFEQTDSEATRKRIRGFMSRRKCEVCNGARLKPEIQAVTVEAEAWPTSKSLFPGLGIHEFAALPIEDALRFVEKIQLTDFEMRVVRDVVREVRMRLEFLLEVGLGYLSLDRESGTLSGGEAQRIRLATQIGAGLAGVIYVLDEPSIGLHQRDNDRLIATLRRLRDLGNSVIVVEHDEDTIRAADHVLDIGPGAGPRGGRLVAQGTVEDIIAVPESMTGQYLSGVAGIPVPTRRLPPRKPEPPVTRAAAGRAKDSGWISILGATENNLKDVDAHFPVGCMTCVTGVSGSGKSTLVDDIFRRAVARVLHGNRERAGAHLAITGLEQIDKIIVIDQSPIGRTPRSNPATYSGAFGVIRDLFAGLPVSRVRGYDPGRFSFNVKGGRCETCKGDGLIKIEMHFLPDVYVDCEACGGSRYNRETLEVTYKGSNIADVLAMTIDEAGAFFRNVPGVTEKLDALQDVGLGYLRLGQAATTLSGGEAQRVKLAAELARKSTGRTLYIFDEPTTGLHFIDIHKLLEVLIKLRDGGNMLVIIEHNLEVIKCADWIIDLGPGGGADGGSIVATGTPEDVAAHVSSFTAGYLRRMLA